jgi:hypothetical protein
MNFRILVLLTAITLVSCQSNDKLEDRVEELTKKVETLENSSKSKFRPGMGTLMNAIQIHHLKLWKSGISENWELANFELEELGERFEDLEKYHSGNSNISRVDMIYPQIGNLEKVVKEKNKSAFVSGYESLTATCNSCHQLTKHHYIKIVVPNNSNENQVFTP